MPSQQAENAVSHRDGKAAVCQALIVPPGPHVDPLVQMAVAGLAKEEHDYKLGLAAAQGSVGAMHAYVTLGTVWRGGKCYCVQLLPHKAMAPTCSLSLSWPITGLPCSSSWTYGRASRGHRARVLRLPVPGAACRESGLAAAAGSTAAAQMAAGP